MINAKFRPVFLGFAIAYMGLIFFLSSQPGSLVGIPAPWDKIVHGLSYGLLGFLWQRAIGLPIWAWMIAAMYGLSDEVHQRFVPGRMFDLGDWVADCIGAAIGVWLASRR